MPALNRDPRSSNPLSRQRHLLTLPAQQAQPAEVGEVSLTSTPQTPQLLFQPQQTQRLFFTDETYATYATYATSTSNGSGGSAESVQQEFPALNLLGWNAGLRLASPANPATSSTPNPHLLTLPFGLPAGADLFPPSPPPQISGQPSSNPLSNPSFDASFIADARLGAARTILEEKKNVYLRANSMLNAVIDFFKKPEHQFDINNLEEKLNAFKTLQNELLSSLRNPNASLQDLQGIEVNIFANIQDLIEDFYAQTKNRFQLVFDQANELAKHGLPVEEHIHLQLQKLENQLNRLKQKIKNIKNIKKINNPQIIISKIAAIQLKISKIEEVGVGIKPKTYVDAENKYQLMEEVFILLKNSDVEITPSLNQAYIEMRGQLNELTNFLVQCKIYINSNDMALLKENAINYQICLNQFNFNMDPAGVNSLHERLAKKNEDKLQKIYESFQDLGITPKFLDVLYPQLLTNQRLISQKLNQIEKIDAGDFFIGLEFAPVTEPMEKAEFKELSKKISDKLKEFNIYLTLFNLIDREVLHSSNQEIADYETPYFKKFQECMSFKKYNMGDFVSCFDSMQKACLSIAKTFKDPSASWHDLSTQNQQFDLQMTALQGSQYWQDIKIMGYLSFYFPKFNELHEKIQKIDLTHATHEDFDLDDFVDCNQHLFMIDFYFLNYFVKYAGEAFDIFLRHKIQYDACLAKAEQSIAGIEATEAKEAIRAFNGLRLCVR